MIKYTVFWTALDCHGYHEVTAESAHAAFASVANLLSAPLRVQARFKVFEGTPIRDTQYCMNNMITSESRVAG